MENQSQNTSEPINGSRGNVNATAVFDVQASPAAAPVSDVFPPAPSTSLGYSQPITPTDEVRPRPPRGRRSWLLWVAGALTVFAAAGGGILIWRNLTQPANNSAINTPSTNASQRFDTLSIPLNEVSQVGLALNASRTLSINGQLNVNNSFVLAPTAQPTNGVAGQMYYDKITNQLNYFNGTGFVALSGNPQMVTSLGGSSGVLTLGGGLSIAGNQLRNNGVVSITSASTNLTVVNDGNGNVTLSGGTTAVQSQTGGTPGRVAIFDGTRSLADSIMSQAGNTMAVNGNLALSGTLNMSSAGTSGITMVDTVSGITGRIFNDGNLHITGGNNNLWLDAGGTGTLFLNAGNSNPVAINESTIPLYALEVNGDLNLTTGHSLRINGTVICNASGCSGGGGGSVSSLNGLTGALSIANASAAGSTITINDASTTQKGIAQFNSTNFSAVGGVINTIQDIAVTATPTFGRLTITSSQATSPMILVNNTNLGATGNLIDLQANGISRFTVTPTGDVTLSGSINSQAVSSNTSLTGTLTVTGLSSLNGGATVTGTLTANTITPTGAMTVGSTGQSLTLQGNAGTTLSATSGSFKTSVIFQTPTANVNYRFLTAAAGTYDICTTAGNCTGIGGSVTTLGGTTNAITKFTGSQTIGDSIISDNGSTVTIAGVLAVNTITPTGAMTVGSTGQSMLIQGTSTSISSTNTGVTNTLSFATPSGLAKNITIPNASGTVVVSASTPLSIDSGGNISCPSCLTTAVTSLNGLSGVLSIANASGAGSTITINDATTAAKGIASFNSTNFTVTSGAVNTIQDIAVSSTPTFGRLTVTSSQATNGMMLINNTNAAASGNLLDLQTNSVSQFHVGPAGALTLLGTVNGQTISSSASFTGTLGVTGLASLNGGATVTGTLTANTITPTSSLTVGATTQSFLVQGNASSTITATSGANTTTLSFQTPTASATYRLLTAAAGTYDICTTVGNCAGVGGGVTTSGGTNGTIAKFTGSNSIANSIITDNGSTVTIGGTLAVNTVTPSAAMTIGSTTQNITIQGAVTQLTATSGAVTNTLTFATPGTSGKTITLPNATGTVAVSASGPLALDAAGNLTCPTCLTSGGGGGTAGVASLDGLTGTLTISNTTGVGSTITINDATTAAKGIASFNSTNFTVTSGAVNTIQDIATTSAPTFGRLTVTSSQATNAMMLINNTNGAASGNLLDVQLNGASQLAVSPAGAMTLVGALNGQTISSAANFTGTLAVAGLASLNGGATVTGTLTANTITPSSSLTVGTTTQSFLVQGTAASTIAAVSGVNNTTLSFQAPTAAVTYRFLTAAAGTYDVCTTVGNCAGVGGGVTTPGGTANTVAKFTASGVIGNSSITDNGTTVTIGGTLAVNTLTPTAALTIGATTQNLTLQGATVNLTSTAAGVTNTLTFATPTTTGKTITIPDASGTLVVSASAPLSISAAGNITCPTCVTSAVTSLDTLTGALTIANSTGVGSTITINDATTGTKGIASFNSTNFTVSAGAVNTIQNINTGASPTFTAMTLTGTSALLTVNNTSGVSGLLSLQSSGANRFSVTGSGAITLLGGLNPDITSMTLGGNGNNITIKPGATTTDLIDGAGVSIQGGDSALGNAGGVNIDAGTGGGGGIAIGFTRAAQVNIGNNSATNTIAGVTWINSSNSANTTIGSGTGTAGTITLQGGVSSAFTVTNATGTTKLAFAAPSTTGTVTFQLPAGGTGATTYGICTTLTVCTGYAPATGSGTYFSQGGNSFAAAGNLGTNDANVLNIRTNGVTRLTVASNGANVTLASGVSLLLQGSSSISNPQGTTSGEAFGLSAAVGANNTTALGASSNASFLNSIALGVGATTTAVNQMVIGSSASGISQLVVGNGVTSASPVGFRLQASSGSGTNVVGADMDIAGGQGTGTGKGGDISFLVARPGGSGSALNSLATVGVVSGTNGSLRLQNSVDGTTALQVQNTGSSTVFDVDTLNSRVGINTNAPTASLQVNQNSSASGTVSNSAASTTVTGSGTTFTSTFMIGDTFTVTSSGNTCTIAAINSDTNLTCATALASLSSGSAYSFTPQVRLASNTNGQTSVSGNLTISSPGTTDNFNISTNTTTGNLQIGGSIIGNASTGGAVDTGNTNILIASKFNSGAGGTSSTLRIYLPAVGTAPNNHIKVAVYSDSAGAPGSLVSSATAPSTVATAGWNTIPLGATVTFAPNTTYWLGFNVDNTATSVGYNTGAAASDAYVGMTYSSNFPSTFGTPTYFTAHYSIYTPYITPTVPSQSLNQLAMTNNGAISLQPTYDQDNFFTVSTANGTKMFDINTASQYVGASKLVVNSAFTSATLNVGSGGSSASAGFFYGGSSLTVPLVILQAGATPGASADLLQFRDSNGDIHGGINNIGNQLTLGRITSTGTTSKGTIILSDGTASNFSTTIQTNGTLSGNSTFQLNVGSANGTYQICTTLAICTGYASAGSMSLQTAYNNSTNPEIVLNATNGALTLRDAATPFGTTANLFEVQNNAGTVTYLATSANGTVLQPGSDNTTVFNVVTSLGNNVFTVDTLHSRAGIALGGTNTPNLNGAGLEIGGALRLSGGSGNTDLYHTPQGSNVSTAINVVNYDPGAFGQIMALGIPGSTVSGGNVDYRERVLSLFDNRTSATGNAMHQPTLAVFSPNEGSMLGLSWNGSNSTGNFQTNDLVSGSTANVLFGSGQIYGASTSGSSGHVYLQSGGITSSAGGYTSGNIYIQSGSVAGTGTNSGGIYIDTGNISGGTSGNIQIGATNAPSITIGHTAGATNATTTIHGLSVFKPNTDSHQALLVQNNAGSNLFVADTTSYNIGVGTGTQSLANLLQVGSYTTADYAGTLFVGTGTNTHKGVVIQGVTAQSADLLEMQDLNGASLLAVTSAGNQLFGNAAAHSISVNQSASSTGKDLSVVAGQGATGSVGGNLYLQAGANGTAAGTPGSVIVKANGGNSTSAFQVQRSDGSAFLNVDTTSQIVTVGAVNSALLAMTVNGGLDQTGYYTSDTGGTFAGQWTQLAECHITTQYQSCDTTINITGGNGPGTTSNTHATVHARVKQQNAMAGVPFVQVSVDGVSEVITKSDIMAVTTVNNATDTRVQLWGRINDSFETWYYTSVINGNYPGWTWVPTSGFQAALPTGTQTAATYGTTYADTMSIQPSANSTTAFQVSNASAISQFSVDTTNSRVYVGPTAGSTTGTILVVGNKTNAGDPTGVAGAMYYNASTGAFRCYQYSGWQDCVRRARTSLYVYSDFTSKGGDNYFQDTASGTGATVSGSNATPQAGHPGIIQPMTGTTTTGSSDEGNLADFILGNGDTYSFESDVYLPALSNGTDTFTVRSGFKDTQTTEAVDGCFFRYTDAVITGHWQGVCRNNNVESTCDTGIAVAATTWYRLTINVNSAGTNTDFQTDGTTRCSITTNIPTGSTRYTGYGTNIIKSAGTTSVGVWVDYMEITATLGTPR